ncbi:hypothetical protein K490DRAFT_7557, partial [Saccharata proteae CBS 121410]
SFESFQLALRPAPALSSEEVLACFALIELTSAAAYKASSRGWKPDAKKREMREDEMQYLLDKAQSSPDTAAVTVSNPIEGFLSFMITVEDDFPVVYIYEIHLLPHLRGLGVGKHLMSIPEVIGQKASMTKIMLTVFKSNSAAEEFYRSLGYVEDEYSPPPKKLRGGKVKMPSYIIMSK